MKSISTSRRNFVRGMAAMPFAVWLARARADGPGTLIRYDAGSPMGLAMLEIYAQAVQLMKLRNPDDPLSWVWQWYTHFVDGATTKSAEITRIFGVDPTPQSTFANEVWNTCQSHAGQNANHFLPWHRIFVMCFEDVIRNVTGHPEFTLPYWNYTSYDPAKRGIVPLQFRLPNDPVWGSLYRPDRTSLANSGQRIDKNQTGDQMDIGTTMATSSYSSVGSVMGFCRSVDSGIHGKIHVLTGNSKNMGAVPYAARDPLFWCHHISIDRLWAIWNLNGGVNPTTASWAQKYFTFADGQGQRVTSKLADYFDLATLGYTYDDLAAPAPPATASTKTKGRAQSTALLVSANAVPEEVARAVSEANLGARPVSVALQRIAGARLTSVMGLSDTADSRNTYLVLKNLHTWKQPEVLFHVYLTPGKGNHALGQANYVGAINFFDAEFHDHGHGAMGDVLGENFYSFDVTSVLRRIEQSGRKADARDSLRVVFVPGGQPTAGANPMVATIELVRQ